MKYFILIKNLFLNVINRGQIATLISLSKEEVQRESAMLAFTKPYRSCIAAFQLPASLARPLEASLPWQSAQK
jgi:hypothetical protein